MRPSQTRSTTIVAMASLTRIFPFSAISSGRTNSPRRSGNTNTLMKPTAPTRFSFQKLTSAMGRSSGYQRATRKKWMRVRMSA